ncbi:UNVERIFIED_CONTAM: hypothetical protein GTU68_041402, partial [Idotea baltica]|nr:hypothetical protein [Idotea baltica]
NISNIAEYVGSELGISEWHQVTQEQINAFAKLTGDEQWIHVNPEKCKKMSPFCVPVAHGYFVLSLCSKFFDDVMQFEGAGMILNYGVNKVRFTNAVKVNSKVRARISLKDFQEIEVGGRLFFDVIIEIEGEEKPACVAETIAQVM